MASQQAPKCLTDGCECEAAKNEYYPNSEGGEFWTLCEKCYEEDQEEEDDDRPFCLECRGYTCGGLGVYEPECCCDSDEESDEEEAKKKKPIKLKLKKKKPIKLKLKLKKEC